MQIIAGKARGFLLKVPDGMDVRPTAVRARKALFDSLGDLSGFIVADIFAGSGALGLEAASRGASSVGFVEQSPKSCSAIRSNCEKVKKAVPDCDFRLLSGRIPDCFSRLSILARPTLIFADPPYGESASFMEAVLASGHFTAWASDASLIWEMPEGRFDIKSVPDGWKIKSVRLLGPARFMFLKSCMP